MKAILQSPPGIENTLLNIKIVRLPNRMNRIEGKGIGYNYQRWTFCVDLLDLILFKIEIFSYYHQG